MFESLYEIVLKLAYIGREMVICSDGRDMGMPKFMWMFYKDSTVELMDIGTEQIRLVGWWCGRRNGWHCIIKQMSGGIKCKFGTYRW